MLENFGISHAQFNVLVAVDINGDLLIIRVFVTGVSFPDRVNDNMVATCSKYAIINDNRVVKLRVGVASCFNPVVALQKHNVER